MDIFKTITIAAVVLLSACHQPDDKPDVLDDGYELSWYWDKQGNVVWVQCAVVYYPEDDLIISRLVDCIEI